MNSPVSIIIGREYFSRVKRKSFIITTILMPVLMLVLMMAPTVFMLLSEPDKLNIAVIDDTGFIAPALNSNDEIKFVPSSANLQDARADEDFDAILVIDSLAVTDPSRITLYTREASSMITENYISGQVGDAIENIRIRNYGIDNLRKIIDDVKADVTVSTVRIDQEEDVQSSSGLNYILGLIMDMLLYMFILIYGQMVMTSIIEEKNNRVLEIVVSSVNPTSLMLGKIVGVGLVAITQILIWGILIVCASAWLVPAILGSVSGVPELVVVFSQLGDVGYILGLLGYMLLFFIGGYLFYSSIYAAVGSAVDNIQDAGQLSSIATMPVIIGIVGSMSVINNPTSDFAFWISVIPFTSPMAMMSRIPFGIPVWEIIVSLVVLYASFMFMIWLSAKIYRVGIFMYGKKPKITDLIRWARYK